MILEAIGAGFAAGIFGALVGLGGGILIVPILVLGFGLPMADAIPASLVGVVATAMGGTASYLRDGFTDVTLAVRAGSVTVLGAMIGARIGVRIPDQVLQLSFAALIFIIVWRMLAARHQGTEVVASASVLRAGSLFMGAGVLSGLLGVGGGILNVPAIRLAMRRDMLTSVATSTMIIAFTGAAGAATYASAGLLKWSLAAGCATGAFTGGRLGAMLAPHLKWHTLQKIFVGVVLYIGVEFAVRGLGLPWWR